MKKTIIALMLLVSFIFSSVCFASPTESIAGAYIGMTKAELVMLPGYQNGISATKQGDIYHAEENDFGYIKQSKSYQKNVDFMVFDKGTCFVYFKDDKIITIQLSAVLGSGRIDPIKKLDKSGLSIAASWSDFKESFITKEYPEHEWSTWLVLQDDTYLTFSGPFGAPLDNRELNISGIYLSKYVEPFNLEEMQDEKMPIKEEIQNEEDEGKGSKEKQAVDTVLRIFGF